MREVVWSSSALDDVERTVTYIARKNPIAGGRVFARIDETARRLGIRPIGRSGRVAGTYEKPVTRLPYIIAYALQELPSGEERVVILRVIHMARNWPPGKWPE